MYTYTDLDQAIGLYGEVLSMRNRRVERCTRLVAVAMLITAAFSTGMQHAHPGGSSPHAHHDAAELEPALPAAEVRDEPAWLAAPLHMHISLLGFEFTLPAQDQEHEESSGSGEQMLVVRLIGDDVTDSAARVPTAAVIPHAVVDFAAVLPVVTTPELRAVNRQASLPLCDSARHERSGVLRT